jgi:hypothetical protein
MSGNWDAQNRETTQHEPLSPTSHLPPAGGLGERSVLTTHQRIVVEALALLIVAAGAADVVVVVRHQGGTARRPAVAVAPTTPPTAPPTAAPTPTTPPSTATSVQPHAAPETFSGLPETRGLLVSDWATMSPQRRQQVLRAELRLVGKPVNAVGQQRKLANWFNGPVNGPQPVGPSLDGEAQYLMGQVPR